MNQRFNRTLSIGKDTGTTAISAGVVPLDSALLPGDVAVINAKTGGVITSLTGVKAVKVIQKGENTTYMSDLIQLDNLTSASKKAYVAPTYERKTIGYNGTSGSFPVENNTHYSVSVDYFLTKDHSDSVHGNKIAGNAKSKATAVQFEILKEIADNFNLNSVFNIDDFVYAAPLLAAVPADTTGITALDVGVGDLTVTKGSKVISVATDITADAALAVGDTLIITDGTASFTGAAGYKVKAIYSGSNEVELEGAYLGASETIATASFAANVKVVKDSAISGISADAGILFEAQDVPYKRGFKQYDRVYFDIVGGVNTSDVATVTTLVNSSFGSGSGYIVADLEEMYRGNSAPYQSRTDELAVIKEEAVLTETYDLWNISTANKMFIDGIGAQGESPIQVTVALPTTRTGGDTAAAAAAVLDLIDALV